MENISSTKIPLIGKYGAGLYAITDGDYDGEWFSTLRLRFNPTTGYVMTAVDSKNTYLHHLVLKPKKGFHIDHINRDKLDNRSCNLRWVTPSVNTKNSDWYDSIEKVTPEERKVRRLAWAKNYQKTSLKRKVWAEAHKEAKRIYDRERYLANKHTRRTITTI